MYTTDKDMLLFILQVDMCMSTNVLYNTWWQPVTSDKKKHLCLLYLSEHQVKYLEQHV